MAWPAPVMPMCLFSHYSHVRGSYASALASYLHTNYEPSSSIVEKYATEAAIPALLIHFPAPSYLTTRS